MFKIPILNVYFGHSLLPMATGLKQPTQGNMGTSRSNSSRHHFGPTAIGVSVNTTLFAGISRVATIYRPNSFYCKISNGLQSILCVFQCFFWWSTPQYEICLHAVHLNGASASQIAHLFPELIINFFYNSLFLFFKYLEQDHLNDFSWTNCTFSYENIFHQKIRGFLSMRFL